MDASARLGLAYLAPGQLQKHVTLNETLTRLDVLVQTRAVSRTLAAQPSAPADGALYILPASPSGVVWSGFAVHDLVRFEAGGWAVVGTVEGVRIWIADEACVVVRTASGWTDLGQTLGAVQGLERLGLNTTADAANPFAARVNKALWTAVASGDGGDGDLRMTFNKEAAADVGSLLFQSGWSGRAELGLIGDDNLSLKVSPDGSTWRVAMTVDRTTGAVTFAAGGGRVETTVLTAGASWTIPVWARRIEAVCVGGSGGGGSGAAGASGAARFGGGGGAGGVSLGQWARSDLAASLTVTVGAGGAGGASVTSGAGADGGAGSATTLASAGVTLLTGLAGAGGRGGQATSGLGGAGGAGAPQSNAGGDSRTDAAGQGGGALQRPDGGGGGGAGGGLMRPMRSAPVGLAVRARRSRRPPQAAQAEAMQEARPGRRRSMPPCPGPAAAAAGAGPRRAAAMRAGRGRSAQAAVAEARG